MSAKVLDIKAEDNKYLHRDFHASGDAGVAYIGNKFGDNGVREYLNNFTDAYYAPLIARIKIEGLMALKDSIEKTYEIEEMPEICHTSLRNNELFVKIDRCPGVIHMFASGRTPSKWYFELTRTVNMRIADAVDFGFEWITYDESNGAAEYRFFKRGF